MSEEVKVESISFYIKASESHDSVQFKVKPGTKFSKVIDAYCKKKALDPNAIRLLYNGQRVASDDTPAKLELEEGDTIEAFLQQIGGGSGSGGCM
mmetsp:Transcript_78219/g.172620  ORF Transcript_78219/g.172620 Transcript_78219/m.172620 type:complete len:95 (-) Transcript_78219:20-304(-)